MSKQYECCKCKWKGNSEQKVLLPATERVMREVGGKTETCPKCSHDEFYTLNESGKRMTFEEMRISE